MAILAASGVFTSQPPATKRAISRKAAGVIDPARRRLSRKMKKIFALVMRVPNASPQRLSDEQRIIFSISDGEPAFQCWRNRRHGIRRCFRALEWSFRALNRLIRALDEAFRALN